MKKLVVMLSVVVVIASMFAAASAKTLGSFSSKMSVNSVWFDSFNDSMGEFDKEYSDFSFGNGKTLTEVLERFASSHKQNVDVVVKISEMLDETYIEHTGQYDIPFDLEFFTK